MAARQHNVRSDPLCGTVFNEKTTTFSTRRLTYETKIHFSGDACDSSPILTRSVTVSGECSVLVF